MSKLMERVLKASGNPYADVFDKSKIVSGTLEYITTPIPMLNVALSGKWDGGLTPGLTVIAGKSKHFKSLLGLQLVKAFLDKHADGICVYLDSELGFGKGYLESNGIDPSRIAHIPVTNIEEAKFQLVSMIEETKPTDNVIFFFDSIGNSASKKELDDAVDQKSVADMSRAKSLKSFFRIVTPMVNLKKHYFVCINHIYSGQGLYPIDIMSGGQGPELSANTIFFMGRSKDKEGTEVVGFKFNIKIEKSRYVKEGMKFPLEVSFEKGIDLKSGLFDFAVDHGFIEKPSQGWYTRPTVPGDKKWRLKEIEETPDFWDPILTDDFKRTYEKEYALS